MEVANHCAGRGADSEDLLIFGCLMSTVPTCNKYRLLIDSEQREVQVVESIQLESSSQRSLSGGKEAKELGANYYHSGSESER